MKYAILCTVCLGTVLSSYVSSCTNIALPNIMAALNFDMNSVVWVSLSYLLPYGSILPLTGKLGDQFGAKKMYIAGLIIFTLGSLLCGVASNATTMLIYRMIQGIGAGMLLPNAMIIVVETFEPSERGQALGLWSAMAAAGSAMGPTIGGYLIESIDWRSIFFSVVPFCAISIVLAFMMIPASKRNADARADFWGASLLTISLSALLIALNKGQVEGWTSLYITLLFYLSFAAFVTFIMAELRVEHPMVELSLFHNVNFAVANILGFISFLALYGGMFLLPFFLKSILHYSSISAGVMLLPLTVTMIIFAPLGGRIADKFGSRIPAFLGIMLIAVAIYLLSSINASYSTRDFFTRLVLFGVGLGFTMSPLSNCAISALPKDKVGMGSGILNLFKIIGGSMGVVFVETILSNRQVRHYQILSEYLNTANQAPQEIFKILQGLWGTKGMNVEMLTSAAHGWFTGEGFLAPQRYAAFKAMLAEIVHQQATILSFEDVFYILAILCFCSSFLALFIKNNKQQKKPALLNNKDAAK
jgi:EmrB/QacA subfamily drug resistance transporter